MINKVQYLDKSYTEKRKILRKFHFQSKESNDIINKILYKIIKKVKYHYLLDSNDFLQNLLIDGYICYEKKYINGILISLIPIDVVNLTIDYVDNETVYILNKDKNNQQIFTNDQIIYIMSPTNSYISIAEMVFLNIMDIHSKYTIKYYIDNIIKLYNDILLKLK
jgi:hypothetical protein